MRDEATMSEKRVLFLALSLQSWRNLETNIGIGVAGGPGAGYLSVYETRREAEEAHPGYRVVPVAVSEKAEGEPPPPEK